MTRAEHVAWCKERALEYINRGEVSEGIASMLSDMRKHPETASPGLDQLTMMLMLGGHLDTPEQARKHIEGYN